LLIQLLRPSLQRGIDVVPVLIKPPMNPICVFLRRRVAPRVEALAVSLYHKCLSLRGVRDLLAWLGDGWVFSHEALRRWFRRAGELMPVRRRRRRAIALDKTMVKVVGAVSWLWSAAEPGNGETGVLPEPPQVPGRHVPVPRKGCGKAS